MGESRALLEKSKPLKAGHMSLVDEENTRDELCDTLFDVLVELCQVSLLSLPLGRICDLPEGGDVVIAAPRGRAFGVCGVEIVEGMMSWTSSPIVDGGHPR